MKIKGIIKTRPALNPYKIGWVFLFGPSTAKDKRILTKAGFTSLSSFYKQKGFQRHGPSIDFLKKVIKDLPKLENPYIVLYITDKQYGMMNGMDSEPKKVATTMQLQKMYILK